MFGRLDSADIKETQRSQRLQKCVAGKQRFKASARPFFLYHLKALLEFAEIAPRSVKFHPLERLAETAALGGVFNGGQIGEIDDAARTGLHERARHVEQFRCLDA